MIDSITIVFDCLCIGLALYYGFRAKPQYRKISYMLMTWFVISEASFNNFFVEYQKANDSFIYVIYSLIIIPTLFQLKKLNAHMIIFTLLSANLLLNAITILYFVYDFIPEFVYNVYKYLAGLIALTVIYYMFRLTKQGVTSGGDTDKTCFYRVLWMRWNDFRRVYVGGAL